MITSEVAIDKAVQYLQGMKPDYLGGAPKNIRLETIQLFGKEWVVILSYTISVPRSGENVANQLLEALSTRSYFKEFEIDSQSGAVIGMRNPQAPSPAGAHSAA